MDRLRPMQLVINISRRWGDFWYQLVSPTSCALPKGPDQSRDSTGLTPRARHERKTLSRKKIDSNDVEPRPDKFAALLTLGVECRECTVCLFPSLTQSPRERHMWPRHRQSRRSGKKISPEGMWDAGMTFAESVKSRSRSENLPICGPGNSIRRPVGSLSLSDVRLRPRHYNNYIIRLYNEIFVVLTCERSHTMSYTRESSSWTSWGTLCILTVI